MADQTDVAVIGAGPYGLALAAHLTAAGVGHRVFGTAMQTWRTAMPRGMVLKSDGFASSLYDPDGAFPLSVFCREIGEPYADIGLPVKLETFVAYGLAFQRRFVPELEERSVIAMTLRPNGFELRLDDGQIVLARRVVVASGIRSYAYTPPELEGLPPALLTHSAAHSDLTGFAGRQVLIIGAGASAMDMAALLDSQGARVTVLTRRPEIRWCGAPRPRTLLDDIRAPVSGLGTGWRSLLCTRMPMVFHAMPEGFRVMVTRRHLGPAPGWAVRDQVEKHVGLAVGSVIAAEPRNERARIRVRLREGDESELAADHVIAATGYRVDVRRLEFLGPPVLAALRCAGLAPRLSRQFESSVPGLFFVGAAAANSFGPMLRFAYGAGFAARRLSRHLARTGVRPRAAFDASFRTAPVTPA